MKDFLKNNLYFLYAFLLRIRSTIYLIFHREYVCAKSYFPEYSAQRRKRSEIFLQQFCHIWKHGTVNEFYFLYGLDIKGMHNANNYVDYRTFMIRRDSLNKNRSYSMVSILRDKFLFGIVAKALGVPTAHNIGVVEDDVLYMLDTSEEIDFREYVNNNTVDTFIKSIDGECADGVYHLVIDKGNICVDGEKCDYSHLKGLMSGSKFLLQELLHQHSSMSSIYPKSINTIRLQTVYNRRENKIEVLSPLLRVGTGKNSVDNWAKGGLAIGIDVEKGVLRKYGFYKPAYGTKTDIHPDTGVVFQGYHIPYMAETIDYATRFHKHFKEIHSIGWDIAITENGPCFIEGNDNWEISLVQICDKGLKMEFDRLFV